MLRIIMMVAVSVLFSTLMIAQPVDKIYTVRCNDTINTIHLYKDGGYRWYRGKHTYSESVMGKYIVNNNTLSLITGKIDKTGGQHEFLFLPGDSCFVAANDSSKYCRIIPGKYMKEAINRISRKRFDKLVARSLQLLKTKTVGQISDEDHVLITRIYNTLWMSPGLPGKHQFIGAIYDRFTMITAKRAYSQSLTRRYDWIPNRGMGFFFTSLQIEWGGTPGSGSYYVVD